MSVLTQTQSQALTAGAVAVSREQAGRQVAVQVARAIGDAAFAAATMHTHAGEGTAHEGAHGAFKVITAATEKAFDLSNDAPTAQERAAARTIWETLHQVKAAIGVLADNLETHHRGETAPLEGPADPAGVLAVMGA